MDREDIIRMAREAGFSEPNPHDGYMGLAYDYRDGTDTGASLERFAALVAAHEREKSLRLWMLLDDVDTADDIAKADHAVYRSLCRQAHQKRWEILSEEEVDAAIRARA